MNGLQVRWLEKADERREELTEWEEEFVIGLLDKPENYELSDKQNSVLNRINAKLTDY